MTRISIAIVCALGATAVLAQTVQPRGTQARPPLQTAQTTFPPAGAAASGASTATATTAAAAGAATAGTVAFVTGAAIAVTGAASDQNNSGTPAAVTHNP